MTTNTLRAILVAMGATDPDSLTRVRAALPDLAEQCAELATGDFAPCAGIGPVDPVRQFADYDRNAIDASAEREGVAIEHLEDYDSAAREVMRHIAYRSDLLPGRTRDGRTTCQWDYQRAARHEALLDDSPDSRCRARKYRARYQYAKRAAVDAWQQVCNDFATDNWRQYVWRGDWRPAWLRDESAERREQRKLNRARRDIIRLVGSLAKSGNVRARELYRTLQPAGVATGRKRK